MRVPVIHRNVFFVNILFLLHYTFIIIIYSEVAISACSICAIASAIYKEKTTPCKLQRVTTRSANGVFVLVFGMKNTKNHK